MQTHVQRVRTKQTEQTERNEWLFGRPSRVEGVRCILYRCQRYDHREEKARKMRQKQNNHDRYAFNEFTR